MSEIDHDYTPNGADITSDDIRRKRSNEYGVSDPYIQADALKNVIQALDALRKAAKHDPRIMGPTREPVSSTLVSEIIRLSASDLSEPLSLSREAADDRSLGAGDDPCPLSLEGSRVMAISLSTLLDVADPADPIARSYAFTVHETSKDPRGGLRLVKTVKLNSTREYPDVWRSSVGSSFADPIQDQAAATAFLGIRRDQDSLTVYDMSVLTKEVKTLTDQIGRADSEE